MPSFLDGSYFGRRPAVAQANPAMTASTAETIISSNPMVKFITVLLPGCLF